jgi:hypothetical protein
VPGYHLFSRAISAGPSPFTYRDSVSTYDYDCRLSGGWHNRNANRPELVTLPDGRIVMSYVHEWYYTARAVINAGSTVFNVKGYIPAVYGYGYGTAVDPRSGDIFSVHASGDLDYYPAEWTTGSATPLSMWVDYDGQGPNRRTLTTAPNGTAVLTHNIDPTYPYAANIARRVNGTWTRFTPAENLGLYRPQVFYQASSGKFLLLGRINNVLTLYSWISGDTLVYERTLP